MWVESGLPPLLESLSNQLLPALCSIYRIFPVSHAQLYVTPCVQVGAVEVFLYIIQ